MRRDPRASTAADPAQRGGASDPRHWPARSLACAKTFAQIELLTLAQTATGCQPLFTPMRSNAIAYGAVNCRNPLDVPPPRRAALSLMHTIAMHVAILTFEGFNELDSLLALGILNRIEKPGWRVTLASPAPSVTSMNGVTVRAQSTLADACAADAVIIGSGIQTRAIASDAKLMAQLQLDPSRQLIGAQCSGTLLLAKLGPLGGVAACTDLTTKPWVQEAGVEVLNQAFYARGNIATAGGCLASQYLAAWVIARAEGIEAARGAIHYVAPVGEKEEYVARAMKNIAAYLGQPSFDPSKPLQSA